MKEIIGISRVDYISKKTNQNVKGYTIFFQEPIDTVDGFGLKGDNVFLNDEKYNVFLQSSGKFDLLSLIGLKIRVNYNKHGVCESVERIRDDDDGNNKK